MAFGPNFTGPKPGVSKPVWSDAQLFAQAQQAAAEEQANAKAQQDALTAQQDAMAQKWIDSLTAQGGLTSYGARGYGYGPIYDTSINNLSQLGQVDPGGSIEGLYATPGTQYGNIDPVYGYIPTLDEAKSIMGIIANGGTSNGNNYASLTEQFSNALGGKASPQLVNWLAANAPKSAANTTGDPWKVSNVELGTNSGMFPEGLNAYSASGENFPYLTPLGTQSVNAGTVGTGLQDFFGSVNSAVNPESGFGPSIQTVFGQHPQQPSAPQPSWEDTFNANIAAKNQAAQTAAQAFQKNVLGGGFKGGVIDQSYSQPFGGALTGAGMTGGGFTPGDRNSMAWGRTDWGSPGFGAPGSNQSISSYQPQQRPGGLGGFGGWGGAWGAPNAWTGR